MRVEGERKRNNSLEIARLFGAGWVNLRVEGDRKRNSSLEIIRLFGVDLRVR